MTYGEEKNEHTQVLFTCCHLRRHQSGSLILKLHCHLSEMCQHVLAFLLRVKAMCMISPHSWVFRMEDCFPSTKDPGPLLFMLRAGKADDAACSNHTYTKSVGRRGFMSKAPSFPVQGFCVIDLGAQLS